MIDQNSRYAATVQAARIDKQGHLQRYVVPRILPHPEDHVVAQHHRVTDSDRPDTLAARAYGQATSWWLLADANTSPHPDQLTEVPGTLRMLPSPEGRMG